MTQDSLTTTLFLKDFTVLDFAYLCPKFGAQGESFWVSAELTGKLDHQGFIMDFGKCKKLLKQVVDDSLDHRLAVATKSANITKISAQNNTLMVDFQFGNGMTAAKFLHYAAPEQAYALLDHSEISKSAIIQYLEEKIAPKLGQNISKVRILLREEESFQTEANFRYTHGLKLHDGNCQRLLHGHRNIIEVFVDQKKSPKHEQFLANRFENAHFATRENVKNLSELDLPLGERQKNHPKIAKIFYNAPQGAFLADIPADTLVLLENEPSIENITAYAWKTLQKEFSLSPASLEVHGYEGLQKGAVVKGNYN